MAETGAGPASAEARAASFMLAIIPLSGPAVKPAFWTLCREPFCARISAMSPKKSFVLFALALVIAGCATAPKKAAKDPEKDPQVQYEKAVISVRYGLEDEALKYLNLALTLDPAHVPSLLLLGNTQFKKGNYAEAASAFEKYLELQPKDARAHASLGLAYENLGMGDKSEAEFRSSLTIDGNADAAFGLAKLYYEQNKLEAALEHIQIAIGKNSKSAAYYNLQGVIFNQMHRYADALLSFRAALQLAPDDVYVTVNLGIAYINTKEYTKARDLFEKLLPKVQDEVLRAKINEYLNLIRDNK
jgi:Flp pilus assembly protein TadD